jgi:hypothetical protein
VLNVGWLSQTRLLTRYSTTRTGLGAPGATRQARDFEFHTLSTFFPKFLSILALLVVLYVQYVVGSIASKNVLTVREK